ncbi:GNAT family N-acetyltransferase [uncultured Ilyobacter sp.]|uniref:GNAT family N-acetyltransferase n=1 Tax=uncultured Ilyobacter sp. TaxID=544433 RepID=UPI0029C733C5|nr:GNAT family N-acetyltransferase [uncultured Ilyobacter sp.]
MKIDYSFPHIFFGFLREKSTIEEFLSHPFSKFIAKEVPISNNKIEEIKKNSVFMKFLNNEDTVTALLEELIFHESIWAQDVKNHMVKLFPEYISENIEVFFTLGGEYSSKNEIFINIDKYLENSSYREVIPEIIYRTTLLLYIRKHTYNIDLKHLSRLHYIEFINYLIHYKGAAAYSTRFYMNSSSFNYSNSFILKGETSLEELLSSYNSLSETLKGEEDINFSKFLEANSFPENLGYQIFKRTILSGKSFYEVVSTPFPEFIDIHLPPMLPQSINTLAIGALTENYAREISCWKYPNEYSVYNFPTWSEMSKLRWAITFKEKREKEFRGFFIHKSIVGFGQIVKGMREISIGIGIRPDLCGCGYGTRIVSLLIKECRDIDSNAIISLKVRSFNKRAINCYKKLGFQEKAKYKTYSLAGEVEFIKMELH